MNTRNAHLKISCHMPMTLEGLGEMVDYLKKYFGDEAGIELQSRKAFMLIPDTSTWHEYTDQERGEIIAEVSTELTESSDGTVFVDVILPPADLDKEQNNG